MRQGGGPRLEPSGVAPRPVVVLRSGETELKAALRNASGTVVDAASTAIES